MTDVTPVHSTLAAQTAASVVWDVVVVGGGPAGSVLAREVATLSKSVLLVDKAAFPRNKVCGCCLNAAGLEMLNLAGLSHVPARCGTVRVDRIDLRTTSAACRLPVAPGAVISREELDAELLREAVGSGVQLLTETTAHLDATLRSPHRLELVSDGARVAVQAKLVVAADGLRSSLLRGQSPFVDHTGPAARIGGGAVLRDDSDAFAAGTIYMAVGRGGYVGLVRMSDGKLDVAAALDPAHLKQYGSLPWAAASILTEAQMPPVKNLEQAVWHGTPRLTHELHPVADGRIFAVGDAAAYVEPFTGEGMAWALASGWHAAPLVAGAVGDDTGECERRWMEGHQRLLGRRMRICRTISHVLRRPALTRGLLNGAAMLPAVAGLLSRSVGRPLAA